MAPNHGALLYEGKAKRVYYTDNSDEFLVHFKNDATAFNAKKHAQLEGKGSLNCEISTEIFKLLERNGIATHFLNLEDDCWMLVQRVDVIPIEIVIRNIASGSLCKQTPIAPGTELSRPLMDLYLKDDVLEDPLLTEERIDLLNLLSSSQRKEIQRLSLRVNDCLKEFMKGLDLLLVDFKLEMGFNGSGQLLIADEISPDSCRIWDLKTNDQDDRILDKDRFRKDLGGVLEGYSEILRRIKAFNS
ncbi:MULTISPECIES: phosphoribosylaminoimidazolesuccinocarboxamide synthase [Prochlorococcus]|uniref:Phosphoribosylaminoimidazole-succinocarboxamide synthase n=1 Tax=Prochlorococcus marinus (strain SARG / CCMP1375 / SS120) TaxID=167539 RepID=PUR7_PROMA|nr:MULTISPECIES: phosphoribosylaminoimidazolesuccinocarboxamide synthase [Prochlorococcus]Q7VAN8.1 RecName: Full=Phosphoribosylaminoimidazole-succinocarboxamide synthase; AltName: Full=SAICAR synthetase [Prochlorococcus marinus subsp. marinus str. CCMP1375]AAQ00464.1 Phosphoribosylaminoimidazolesuccinocarboxamide synthase [Prochlorococcus marinus subsp. marinus str. CCMP1375]KGG14345.1 Phosphoribosylaminoimidazole-succinocarboxamide synthase [Prochlorococcus marinus str. LG]KGG22081.1 Phosphori